MKRDINSKVDAVTKDMVLDVECEQDFNIPSLGVTVRATSMNEALIKAKEAFKSSNK
jgi:hypothetical protein